MRRVGAAARDDEPVARGTELGPADLAVERVELDRHEDHAGGRPVRRRVWSVEGSDVERDHLARRATEVRRDPRAAGVVAPAPPVTARLGRVRVVVRDEALADPSARPGVVVVGLSGRRGHARVVRDAHAPEEGVRFECRADRSGRVLRRDLARVQPANDVVARLLRVRQQRADAPGGVRSLRPRHGLRVHRASPQVRFAFEPEHRGARERGEADQPEQQRQAHRAQTQRAA